jgi:hypothetical protein
MRGKARYGKVPSLLGSNELTGRKNLAPDRRVLKEPGMTGLWYPVYC